MARVTVEMMGKPGCHLCDDARVIMNSVLDEFPEAEFVEHNILDDAEMFETMKNDIPVVVVTTDVDTQRGVWTLTISGRP